MKIEQVTGVTNELLAAFQKLIPQLTTRRLPPDEQALSTLIASDSSVLLVARNVSGEIIGAATLVLFRTPVGLHARLEDLIVDESARGQGVGQALTAEVTTRARTAGADYISFTSNPVRAAANGLYLKMGFKRWETNVYRMDFDL